MISTKASKHCKEKRDFQATKFTDYKPKEKSIKPFSSTVDKDNSGSSNMEFDIRRARHEILKFGTNGLETNDKQMAQIALAIRLGAKPLKNSGRNYKDIIAERKQKTLDEFNQNKFQQLGKNGQGAAIVTYRKLQKARLKKKLNGEISKKFGVVNQKAIKRKKE